MTARSINFTYTLSNGTLLPGYLPRTQFFGLNSDFNAPGVPFLLGRQYELDDLYTRAASRGWYTQRSDLLNTPLSSLLTKNLTLQTTLEPFRDFNIRLDARRQQVENEDVFYRLLVDEELLLPTRDANGNLTGDLAPIRRLGTGSFSMSIITVQTLFGDREANGTISKSFNRFVENRQNVFERLNAAQTAVNPNPIGSYGYNSQDVLLPAFLDAYRGKSSKNDSGQKFNPFLKVPIPNWRIDYNGLAELPLVKRYFRSITLRHAYASVYNVGGYNTASQYQTKPKEASNLSTEINAQGRFIPYYVIGQVSIAERLSPLIGVDFQTLEKVTGRLELRTERDIGLNTTNAQVTELYTQELVIGFGYVTNGLKLPFGSGNNQRVLNNELTARLDLSIRDNTTIQRTILDVVDPGDSPEPSVGRAVSLTTNGNRQVQLRPTVDYVLNQRLNLQFFFTRNISDPRVNNAFKTSSTEGGVQLRYSLGQ
jgi:cell surface protein SprA